jgi:hypothetical protein
MSSASIMIMLGGLLRSSDCFEFPFPEEQETKEADSVSIMAHTSADLRLSIVSKFLIGEIMSKCS